MNTRPPCSASEAWPQFLHGRPVLVYPRATGLAEEGWTSVFELPDTPVPSRQWFAVLEDIEFLLVQRPGGRHWFAGPLQSTREWRRAARSFRSVLQLTGPFTSPGEFAASAAAGEVRAVTVPFVLVGRLW
ncbi:hypothetical protein ACEZCY_03865 [Streptacidiphilus sp. N1-12]|uniref:Uncharacterized protein n=2 Tax=Streptacidiphilus alkalitolerans TaxID=3342712 RepID=A0ABV6V3W3_9ACTN